MKLALRFRADYNKGPSLWFSQCSSVNFDDSSGSFGEALIKNLSTMRRYLFTNDCNVL